jgi:Zn-dependent peptidase ImmA (M78 family)/transcriptional regulator with XRE-family HTH domain
MTRAEFLRGWTEQLGLSAARLATEAHLPQPTVRSILAGDREPSVGQIESLARVLGLNSDDLYDDTVSSSVTGSLRVLMKSAEAFHPGVDVRLRILEAARAALDLIELRSDVNKPARLPYESLRVAPSVSKSRKAPFEEGAALARQVRIRLGISGPILSMRDFVIDTLGIPIVAAGLRAEGPDAFTIFGPGLRPAIVLNLDGKNEHGLVRRFSIAREVYHALLNRPGSASGIPGIACQIEPAMKLEREARANAFAMRLLLPEKEVARLTEDELSRPGALRGLMERWGVPRSALLLYVKKVLKLSDDEAARDLPQLDGTCPTSWKEREELPAEHTRLDDVPLPRQGTLMQRVVETYRSGQIGLGMVREKLHVDVTVSVERLAKILDLPPERP